MLRLLYDAKASCRLVEPGDYVLLELSDTGIGMAPDYLARLFNPFSQEDPGTTRRFEGVGLGLALTKRDSGAAKTFGAWANASALRVRGLSKKVPAAGRRSVAAARSYARVYFSYELV